MAPASRNSKSEDDYYGIKGDRKVRMVLCDPHIMPGSVGICSNAYAM